jgi:FkbM family methyltransferase
MHSFLGLKYLPIKTIFDVGANEGQFARKVSKLFPNACIYCFEPLPGPFKKLNRWAEKQKGRVKVFNTALGDSSKESVEMFSHSEHSPSSSILKTTETCKTLYPVTEKQNTISVKLTMLDEWAANLSEPLTSDILIKLDVQGYEDRVIKGGVATFRRARACILEVCLDKMYEKQANFKDILFLLYELGFHYIGNLNQVYADDGHVVYVDAVFVKSKDKLL